MKRITVLFTMLLFGVQIFAQQEARLLRFPTINGNNIVFTFAGNLYTVDANGGTARKLTNDTGFEMFAKFSPDGKQLAFSGQYDGNTEVYLMPSEGGVPKRITYTATLNRDDVSDRMGPNNIVMTWKNNNELVFRSRMIEFNDFKGQLFLVDTKGNLPTQLPLPRGGFCAYSPDETKLAYNRVFREFRTWKRYRGGQADDVWIYDFKTKKTENVTNNPAQDIFPMWSGNKIYFISDRTKTFNLFSFALDTKETKQLTSFTEFDIKFPSLGDKAIVFENGGYIYKFDLQSEKLAKISIYLNEDFSLGRGGLLDVSKSITNYEISPDGKRALFGSRGEMFTIPQKNGPTRNLTNTSGVHERSSKWSPNGKWIAYISDASGENEIYFMPQDGSGAPVQLTKGADTYKFNIEWSPDSKKILWNDKKLRLQFVDVDSKTVTQVEQATAWEITGAVWSPDSKWISYPKPEEIGMGKIYLYSLEYKKSFAVTDSWYDSGSPTFSEDGKYLYFVSDRNFSPVYSSTEWNHAYVDMSKLYLITLAKDIKSPFAPKSDEVEIKDEKKVDKKESTEKSEKKESKPDVSVKVDTDGITNRIVEIPTPPGNYFNLNSTASKIFYMRNSAAERKPKLFSFDFEKQKETELGEINGYEISADKKKMLVGAENSYAIIDLPSAKIEMKEKLNLSDMKMNLERTAEWEQIFNESWRQMRDFFFDPNMHGNNWEKVRKTYEPLVKYVNHRADLTYIIGEMIGELSVGHSYVGGGDYPKAERIKLGLLGAKLEKDKSGFYKIVKILKGQNWDKATRSPLSEIGVDVKEGEFILAINGKPVNEVNNIYELLESKAGKQVTLKINSSPKIEGSREAVVVPTDDEQPLYYYNWVQNNIEKVNNATDGKVGYIHIPDMGVNGLNQFSKLYYPQLRKEALIIDDRGNGGGNVSPMIIERLRREWTMVGIARNAAPTYDPGGMHVGPKVGLIDEFSASDGDIFGYRFKQAKLGKLIGKRSWGGVVGIRGTLPFVDGGFLNRPEFSRYDNDGKEWIMEGYGVDPDIFVDNDPALESEGVDQQLAKAIQVALEELKTAKNKIPEAPVYPNKSK